MKYATIGLAVASLLTAQQVIWNSWIVTQTPLQDMQISQLNRPSTGSNSVQLISNEEREQRVGRLLHKPTNIYVLGERNSGTNYVAGGIVLHTRFYVCLQYLF